MGSMLSMGSMLDGIHALARTTDGALWLGFRNVGLINMEPMARVEGAHIEAVNVSTELNFNSCGALLEDAQGRLWCGGRSGFGAYEQDGERVYYVRDHGAGSLRAPAPDGLAGNGARLSAG